MLTVNTSLEREVPLMDEQLATQAIKTLAILKARAEPWFVAVGFHLPHLPELVPERFVEQYQSAELPDNQFAPYKMPLVAWSHSGELLGQYSDARALHASGAINSTLPEKYAKGLRQHYYGEQRATLLNVCVVCGVRRAACGVRRAACCVLRVACGACGVWRVAHVACVACGMWEYTIII